MDIQISSNFERYLFEVYDRDAAAITELMRRFRHNGGFSVGAEQFGRVGDSFVAKSCDDDETKQVIRDIFKESGELVDPHTAIGIAAARAAGFASDVPVIAVATAHAAKFPEVVAAATGVRPPVPPRLAEQLRREEHYDVLPADANRLREVIWQKMRTRGATA